MQDTTSAQSKPRVVLDESAVRQRDAHENVGLAAAFPPCGNGSNVEVTHACLLPRIDCRVCLALNASDALARNCDLYDDATVNSSCS